jgi:hygromycin-B 4-O-kinase
VIEPLKPEHSLDAVRAFLSAHLGGTVSHLSPLGGGEWSQTFAYRYAGAEYVIRFSRLEEDFAKDRIAAGFAAPDLPVPRVCEIGETLGGYYAISERAFGEPLDELSGEQMRAMLPSLFATLDAIRRADISDSAGFGPWRADGSTACVSWRDWLLRAGDDPAQDSDGGWQSRLSGWRAKLDASPYAAAFEEALARLRLAVDACPIERHLVHADLLNNNVLVSGGRVAAVLDWGCALYGDFLYDLAWLVFWQPWFPEWKAIDFTGEARRHYDGIGLDVPHFEERLRCYGLHIGVQSQVYNAFRERWGFVAEVSEQTLALARGAWQMSN